jgi:Na+/alanine symporter
MCAEKIQRFLMGIVLTICMVLFVQGMTQIAVILQTFVILMVIIWAFTDFCPSLWVFDKIFGSCYDRNKKGGEAEA